ncbi:MAG: cell division protein ZapA [Thermonemataceae bacterium]
MAQLLPIKIKIADREYPMEVEVEEEAAIRANGKWINQQLKKYREAYSIDDKQDLLSIYAIDCTMQKTIVEKEKSHITQVVEDKMQQLERLIDSVL